MDGLSWISALLKPAYFVELAVIVLLLFLSIWSWSIIFSKGRLLKRLNRQADLFEDEFWATSQLDDLATKIGQDPDSPIETVFVSAMQEWRRSAKVAVNSGIHAIKASLPQRLDRSMSVSMSREMDEVERGMTVLATISSSAPFIGLFGTVWGIMAAFISIGKEQSTDLATIAPSIGVALLATAFGLIAAIPATVAYNRYTTSLTRYAGRLENFSNEFSTILSRQLDESGKS